MIGAALRRVEDERFLAGSGQFIGDLSLPGELHCVFVRSPHAHARIRDIAFSRGTVLTGRDMATDSIGPMRCGWVLPGMNEPPRWALARETVRHVGEPVAMVLAESRTAAEDLAEQVVVDYEPLPLIDGERAFSWTRGERQAVEQAMARASRKVEVELVNNRLCGAASTGDTLYVGTQAPHHIRRYVCEELGIAEADLRVVSRDVGGGFGYKGKHYPEETLVVWAARRLRRPVKWIASRNESFLSSMNGRTSLSALSVGIRPSPAISAARMFLFAMASVHASRMCPCIAS